MKGVVAAANVEDAAALLKIGRAVVRLQALAESMERNGMGVVDRIVIQEARGEHTGDIVLEAVPLWMLRELVDCLENLTLGGLRGLGVEVEVKA